MSSEYCRSEEFTQILSGNRLLKNEAPYAMCYGGHQFGNWAGQLGDGRAINLGEVFDKHQQRQVIQLKGSGPTPYSRFADGFAVLRSSIREFLCSEAMFQLGVPTTRALSLITSGDGVERDMFYSGNPQVEPGAIVSRVAPSFIRFGNFEIFSARGDLGTLEKLVAYTIQFHFPHLQELYLKDRKVAMLQWLSEVTTLTCDMIVHWMRLGFVHGVMNTDNMSILGLTIDYGPYGWLDNFDPTWTPNTTDAEFRRYRYENQPAVAQWNLLQLANALYPLVQEAPELERIVREFKSEYELKWTVMMAKKTGLCLDSFKNTLEFTPVEFFQKLESMLHHSQLDMTLFYRALADIKTFENKSLIFLGNALQPMSYKEELSEAELSEWQSWLNEYVILREKQTSASDRVQSDMNTHNPVFILRNYIAQQAIEDAYQNDFGKINDLLDAIAHPYESHASHEKFDSKRPEWALDKAGCSMLSCSS